MQVATIAELSSRSVLSIGGPQAQDFLQNLVTCDVDSIAPGSAGYGALLTPQGKILFDFILFSAEDAYLIDTPARSAAELAKRLAFYKLRSKVTIEDVGAELAVVACWGTETAPALPGTVALDPRLPALGFRAIVARDAIGATLAAPGLAHGTEADYHAHRISLGVPEGGLDFAFGDTFPHDADMDDLHGVAFDKGCFVGQEVVSRMKHRGTARRRIVPVLGDHDLPPPGTELMAGGRPAGTLGTSAGAAGLALVRLDRVKAALDAGEAVTAGEATLTVALPAWARFSWPDTGSGDGET